MKKLALTLIAATLTISAHANGLNTLLNFGNSTFTVDPAFSQSNFSQTSSAVTFGSISSITAPNNTIFGTFTPANWSGFGLSDFQINVTLTGSNSAPLSIELYDGDSNLLATSSAIGIPTTASNTYFSIPITLESGANLNSVGGFLLKINDSGNIPLSVNSFAAVPEPSTYALLAIGGLGLFLAARRRKVQA